MRGEDRDDLCVRLGVAGENRGGSPGGCCLFCSCQVAYGERRETRSGGRLGRRRFVSGGHAVSTEETHCSSRWGSHAKHFITCVFRRRAAFCFFSSRLQRRRTLPSNEGNDKCLDPEPTDDPSCVRACVRVRPRCCLSAVLPSF